MSTFDCPDTGSGGVSQFRLGSFLAIVVLGLLLAGCSPVYKTVYTFEEPVSNEVRSCTLDCREALIACKAREDNEYRYCQDDYRFDLHRYDRCRAVHRDNNDLRVGCFRPTYFCSRPSYASCEESYAACYEQCGAEVKREQRCVANCKSE